MRIFSEDGDFLPKHFDILRFYDQTLLFTWHGNKLKIFSYDDRTSASESRLLLTPGEVKDVQSFGERIFITCIPYGIYKLSKQYQFALLSSTAIGIGARFYQVIRLENNYISLCDKQAKTSRLLLKHDPIDGATLHIVGLIRENVDNDLLSVLLEGKNDQNELCIFTRGYEIYKITPNEVKILHTCLCLITDIVEVKKNEKLICLLYITNKNTVILMYADSDSLIFEKIPFDHKVITVYAWLDEISENVIWTIHSDGVKTYKSRKILGKHSLEVTELDERNITCLCGYNNEILGLNLMGELVQINVKMQQDPFENKDDDFVQLKPEMLEGTDSIVEAICEKVKELQLFDDELLDQQCALKRINMAACNQKISTIPKLRVQKIANKIFVNCKFGYGMPEKCQLSFSIKSGGRKIFATKLVTENETNIELPMPSSVLFETSDIAIDLITFADESYSWCIVKNSIKDREDDKLKAQELCDGKSNFVNARLAALQNLKNEDRINIPKLNAIKNSIRKEFNVV